MKHFAKDNINVGGNDTNFPLRSIYRTTDANESDCLMNDFEVNVTHVGGNLDLADMKSIDSNNSLFGVTSFDSDVVDDLNGTHDYDCHKGQRMTAITKLQVMLNEVINNHKASLRCMMILCIYSTYIFHLLFLTSFLL
jgi:hypothetical protein